MSRPVFSRRGKKTKAMQHKHTAAPPPIYIPEVRAPIFNYTKKSECVRRFTIWDDIYIIFSQKSSIKWHR